MQPKQETCIGHVILIRQHEGSTYAAHTKLIPALLN